MAGFQNYHGRCWGLRAASVDKRGSSRSWLSLAVADHRKHELFNSCAALALRERQRARQSGCVMMKPMVLFRIGLLILVLLLAQIRFLMPAGEFLMQLPQLHLEFFERLTLHLVLRVALQVSTPSVVVLPENVFGGTH